MHPTILHDLAKAHTSDLHRQAETRRAEPSRPPRPASAGQAQHAFPARSHDRQLIRRVLTLLGARRPSQAP